MQYTLKKSLGQHFLQDELVCKKIVALLDNTYTKQLLEIGPGAGAITKYIIEIPLEKYLAIEIDNEKVNYLKQHFPAIQDSIIEKDFLKVELPYDTNFTIIGNFPYNISSQIMFKLLDWRNNVEVLIGMFQKEVAIRIAAKHGSKDYGILSVLTQCFYNVHYNFDVPASAFNPPPKVISGVITCTTNNNPYNIKDYTKFKSFVKTAFNQRRKTMHNAMKSYGTTITLPEEIKKLRAEQLSPEMFAALFNSVM